MRLSVNLDSVYGKIDGWTERVAKSAAAGVDAVGVYGLSDPTVVAEAATEQGVSFAYASNLVGPTNDPNSIGERVNEIQEAIEIARDLDIEQLNVSPGHDLENVDDAVQFETVVETLRKAAPAAENADISLLVEPLNSRVDHPDHWLNTVETAVMIVGAVDSSHVGILFDFYHEQVEVGNVTETFLNHSEDVFHVHIADVPGRAEPGTGEIDYEFVLNTLLESDYDGYVECEFWPQDDPDEAVQRVRTLIE